MKKENKLILEALQIILKDISLSKNTPNSQRADVKQFAIAQLLSNKLKAKPYEKSLGAENSDKAN